MEGEPVRCHVSNAVLASAKPVCGIFISVKIDTNTAETFWHEMHKVHGFNADGMYDLNGYYPLV